MTEQNLMTAPVKEKSYYGWRTAFCGFFLGPILTIIAAAELVSPSQKPFPFLTLMSLGGLLFGVWGANGKTLPDTFRQRYCSPLFGLVLFCLPLLFFLAVTSFGAVSFGGAIGANTERLAPWFYLASLCAGFIVRERCRADRIRLTTAHWLAFACLLSLPLFLAVSGVANDFRYRREHAHGFEPVGDFLDTDIYRRRGHRFQYVNGYSDTDLKPWDPRLPGSRVVRLSSPSTFTLKGSESLPVLDGAQAAFPLYAAFAAACYADLPPLSEQQRQSYDRTALHKGALVFSNTIYGFISLIDGSVDIFFGAHPSPEQLKLAKEKGKELVLTPIARRCRQ